MSTFFGETPPAERADRTLTAMNTPKRLSTLAASAALIVGSILVAAPAHSADAPCTLSDVTPSKVTIGVSSTTAQFAITTDCPAGSDLQWRYSAAFPDDVPHTEQYPYLQAATYQVGPANWAENKDGIFPVRISTAGNVLAGVPMAVGVSGFIDADHNRQQGSSEPSFGKTTTLTVYRATQFGVPAVSDATPAANSKITFSGPLQRANWDTGQWDTLRVQGFVHLQFQADGDTTWTDLGASVFSTVQAYTTVSGKYRLAYPGDHVSSGSTSTAMHVTIAGTPTGTGTAPSPVDQQIRGRLLQNQVFQNR
jgi:hypothetical protein